MKRYADHNRRKQLAEALVLPKIEYALPVFSNANKMEINRLQKVLKSAASFVIYRFCHTTDIINLKWLPIAERINYYQPKLAHKAIYEKAFPNCLKLTFKNRNERLHKIKMTNLNRRQAKTIHFIVRSVAYLMNYLKTLGRK